MSRRRAVGMLLIPLLAASLLVAWASRRELARPEEWVAAKSEPFTTRVKASGEIRSGDSLTVGCPSVDYMWEYTITSIAEEGVAVEPGAMLLRFDGRKLQERLEVRTSELQTAKKELEKTRLDMEDQRGSLELELIELRAKRQRLERELDLPPNLRGRLELERTRVDAALAQREVELTTARLEAQRETARLRLDAAERKVRRLEESITRIRDGLERLLVTAPRKGYVVLIADWNGEKPKVGESVWQGRPLIELADLSKMEVAAAVAEPDAGLVRVGQRVEVRLDAAPERLFTGKIRRLGRLFRTRSADDPEKVFDALVTIDEPDSELMKPGMAASVEIIAASDAPRVQVPESAVVYEGDQAQVELRRDGTERRSPVRLGPRSEGRVVIVEGVEPGDEVRVRDESS